MQTVRVRFTVSFAQIWALRLKHDAPPLGNTMPNLAEEIRQPGFLVPPSSL
jgi:hypothetical protein